MSSIFAPTPVQPDGRLSTQLREMIADHNALLEVSSRFGVTPSTLRKILAGGSISRFIRKKIDQVLGGKAESDQTLRRQCGIERLLNVYHLYQTRGTLQRVGDEIGLSRERVRQLLVKGTEFGLFEYKPSFEIDIPREKILADYGRLLTLKGVAQANRISPCRLDRLLKEHRIADSELEEIRINTKKAICVEAYEETVRALGHHPTTTELQRFAKTRSLAARIRRCWGSIEAFRSDRGISLPRPRRRRRLKASGSNPLSIDAPLY